MSREQSENTVHRKWKDVYSGQRLTEWRQRRGIMKRMMLERKIIWKEDDRNDEKDEKIIV